MNAIEVSSVAVFAYAAIDTQPAISIVQVDQIRLATLRYNRMAESPIGKLDVFTNDVGESIPQDICIRMTDRLMVEVKKSIQAYCIEVLSVPKYGERNVH